MDEFSLYDELCVSFSAEVSMNNSYTYFVEKYGNNTSHTFSVIQLQTMLQTLQQRISGTGDEFSDDAVKCLTVNIMKQLEDQKNPGSVDIRQFYYLCPTVLQVLDHHMSEGERHHEVSAADMSLSRSAIWGFSILSVTIISLCSLVGISFLPLMKSKVYDKILLYLVTLAVGVLSSNSIFQLIPEGFGIDGDPMTVWRSAVIFGGFYLFYLTENILEKIFDTSHNHGSDESHEKSVAYISTSEESHSQLKFHDDVVVQVVNSENVGQFKNCNNVSSDCSHDTLLHRISGKCDDCEEDQGLPSHSLHRESVTSIKKKKKTCWIFRNYKSIKTVAWLITIADGIHNMIDGLAIGASYSTSALQGLSTSIAIFCEEFPHELGDFAILVSAGMTIKQAAFYNFTSACCCYIGMVVGILVGHDVSAARWIFALAGGVFLYISLAGMLPEAQAQAESKKLRQTPWLCLFIKNFGLLSGFLVMFLLTLFKDRIRFG
ncbi:unnamed protein product [Clavelina lepadiformis]|uniref:Zinc transporter ZIP14 n=1 Tax=Clavelina lepadiformis TaxID=159417 RepID=A0ABP0FD54_CLALP